MDVKFLCRSLKNGVEKIKADIENQPAPIVCYPAAIGFNGYDFRPNIINKAFSKLEKYWSIAYFDTIRFPYPNIIVYQFRIAEPIYEDISVQRLRMLVQNVAEEALTKHMRNYNCYMPIDGFVAVHIREDMLGIAIAQNNYGFEVIAKLRRH